jgi:site-specific DNA recombinase
MRSCRANSLLSWRQKSLAQWSHRTIVRNKSDQLLTGLLFDDAGHRMIPTHATKASIKVENAVLSALSAHQQGFDGAPLRVGQIHRVVVAQGQLLIQITGVPDEDGSSQEIRIPWSSKATGTATVVQCESTPDPARNESLIQSVVRAHAWIRHLHDGKYVSIEALAEANRVHPKVVRQALRLAFLSPDVTSTIIDGRQPSGFSLAQIPKLLPLQWTEHRRLLR